MNTCLPAQSPGAVGGGGADPEYSRLPSRLAKALCISGGAVIMYACQSLPIGHHSNAGMRKTPLPRRIPPPNFSEPAMELYLSNMQRKPHGKKRKRRRG